MVQNKIQVGWITILSGIIGLISYFLVSASVNFNFEFFSNPILIFSITGVSSTMLKWSMLADIFGYYLLLLPLLFYLHEWLKNKTSWSSIFTFCGASYIFAGALGAAILASSWPVLIDKYSTATPLQQEIIKQNFENLAFIVGNGIWNLFDALMFGIWFIAIGNFIKKESAFWG